MCGKGLIGTIASLALLLALAVGFLSSPVPVAAQTAAPAAPVGLALAPGHLKLNVAWTAPSGDVSSYDVEYKVKSAPNSDATGSDPSTGWVSVRLSGTDTEHEITGLTNDTTYQVRVRAVNSAGPGGWSTVEDDPGRPDAPAGLDLGSGNRMLTATWYRPAVKAADISGYDVEYKTKSADDTPATDSDPSTGWVDTGDTGTYTTDKITDLTNGTEYQVRVQAVNTAGSSDWATAEATPGGPDALEEFAFGSGDGELTVTWEPPSRNGATITGYDVHYRERSASDVAATGNDPSTGWVDANHTGTDTDTDTENKITHEITGLTNGQMYQVRVRARNSRGPGAWFPNYHDDDGRYTPQLEEGAAPGITVDPQPAEGAGAKVTGPEDATTVTVTAKLKEAMEEEGWNSIGIEGPTEGTAEVVSWTEGFRNCKSKRLTKIYPNPSPSDQGEDPPDPSDLSPWWDYCVGELGEFGEGDETASFEIIINDDGYPEPAETTRLIFSIDKDTENITIYYVNLTILDNDGFRLAASPTPAEGGGPVTVTATLDEPAPAGGERVTIDPSGTATQGSGGDYTLSSTTFTIPEGRTTGTTTITVNDDNFADPNETIILNARTSPSMGIYRLPLTITDNDDIPTSLTLSVGSATVAENAGRVTVTATLDGPAPAGGTSGTVAVAATSTARRGPGDGSDFAVLPSFNIAQGHRTTTFTVNVVDDAVHESSETIILNASSANPALTASPLTLTITDNDPLPTSLALSVNNAASVTVGEGIGTVTVTVTAALNRPAPAGGTVVTVAVDATSTATHGTGAGSDFAVPSSFTIAEGDRTTTFKITIENDQENESDETIILNATSTNPPLTANQITITISDSYNAPPAFPASETGVRSVAENTPAGHNIGAAVEATDPDDPTPTHTLDGTDKDSFSIVASTGQLRTVAPLDYETKDQYRVIVLVTDGEDVTGASDSNAEDVRITVTINVTNVDEAGKVTLSASQPQVGTAVTATLEDPDRSIAGESWQWQKSGSRTGNYTNISGATSASYTPVTDDAGSFLKATVSYTDGEGAGARKSAEAVSANAVQAAPSTNVAPNFLPAQRRPGASRRTRRRTRISGRR